MLGAPGSNAELTYARLAQAALLPVAAMIVVGLLVGGAVLAGIGITSGAFGLLMSGPSLALGNVTGGPILGLGAGLGSVEGTGMVALLPILIVGLALMRTDLGQRITSLRLALITGGLTGLVWIVASILVAVLTGAEVSSSPRPLASIFAGLSVWLLVFALVRFPGARYLSLATIVWSLLLIVGLTSLEVLEFTGVGASGGELATVALVYGSVYGLLSTNLGALLAVWPFGTSLALPDTSALVPGGAADVGPNAQFYSVAVAAPWLWLVPLVVLALIGWCGWRSTAPTSKEELRRRALTVFGGLWLGLAGATMVGAPRLSIFDSLVTGGVSAAPFSLIVPAAVFAAAWLGTLYLRANQEGSSWASLPALEATGDGRASDLWERARGVVRDIVNGPAAGDHTAEPDSVDSAPVTEPGGSQSPGTEPGGSIGPGPGTESREGAGAADASAPPGQWQCPTCGATVTTAFCPTCGHARPDPSG